MIRRLFHCIISVSGILFLMLLAISFSRIPFDIHRWLGTKDAQFDFVPSTIIMLGGSGMPSESNLIRLNYTRDLAIFFPAARILICHPEDSATLESMNSFLKAFEIDTARIHSGSHGNNTREQAIELMKIYPGIEREKIIIVTSPENMYRSLKTFRKLNFKSIGGVASFENAMFTNLAYDHKRIGGNLFVPDVSANLGLRYNFWNYLKLEITCLREFAAIIYYRLNSWI